jgi:phosphoglycerate dehydrogenase-like enzyme
VSEPIRYLSTLALPEEWLARLRSAVPDLDVRQIAATTPDDVPDEVWQGVHVLHTSGVFPEPALVPDLRWIQLDTSGVDHVLGTDLWAGPVPITTIGGVSPVPLAEYVLWAILGAAHRLPAMLEVRAARAWPDPVTRWRRFLPAPLAGATVVVVGYGRIGREIGRRVRAHGMSVVGVSRSGRPRTPQHDELHADFSPRPDEPDETLVVGPDRLAEVFAQADYAVVVLPLTPQTRGLVDENAIQALKPGAVVVNVARGGVLDEKALLEALRSGKVCSVILDVFEDEPLPASSPWWDEAGCFLTPHVSGLAPLYFEQVLDLVVANLGRLRDGLPLLNLVDRTRGY